MAKKKMSIPENSRLLSYLPAELHRGKETYVDYYIVKPGTNVLFRKKIKLNRVKKKVNRSEFERYCRALMKEINERLAYGWNPFIEQEAGKGYTLLSEALDSFMKSKCREMTKNSVRSYKSFISMLKEYLKNLPGGNNIFCINFNQQAAREYMAWCWTEKKTEISGRTYNGYKRAYHSIWAWLVENSYAKVNVFDGITRKKEKKKNRAEISKELRSGIKKYLVIDNNPAYWLMCELCFYCLIRPVEMCRIKTWNVNLDDQYIRFESSETKNGQERISTIPKHIIPLLAAQLETGTGPLLFSRAKGWIVGSEELDSREISRVWANLRPKLNIPKNIQFYSQRDSGIIFLLDRKINPEYVRAQADHYSLEMTTEYSNHFRPEGIEAIKNLEVD